MNSDCIGIRTLDLWILSLNTQQTPPLQVLNFSKIIELSIRLFNKEALSIDFKLKFKKTDSIILITK